MDLVLNDIELSFVSLWSGLSKALGQLCLADCNHSLVLEASAERNLYEALVACYAKHQIVVVKLSLNELAALLLIQ